MNAAMLLFFAAGLAVWWALVGRLTPVDAVLGALVVASAWAVSTRLSDFAAPLPMAAAWPWVGRVVRYFLGYVAGEVVISTWRVTAKVLSPRLDMHPAIVAVAVPGRSRLGLLLLAYGISLTPGQQIVAVDEARRVLYVHTTDAPDPEGARQRILAVYRRYLEEAP